MKKYLPWFLVGIITLLGSVNIALAANANFWLLVGNPQSLIPISPAWSLGNTTYPVQNGFFFNLGVSSTPVNPTDAANKRYVDNQIAASSTSEQFWTLNGTSLVPSSTVYKVGIGTNVATSTLEILSGGTHPNNPTINVTNSNGLNLLHLNGSGELGLGFAAPIYKIQTNGVIDTETNGTGFQILDSADTNAPAFIGATDGAGNGSLDLYNNGPIGVHLTGNAASPIYFSNTSVGFGTPSPSPSYAVDIVGDAHMSGTNFVNSISSVTGGDPLNLVTQDGTGPGQASGDINYSTGKGQLFGGNSGNQNFTIGSPGIGAVAGHFNFSGGNVGINNSNPQYPLDINGNVNLVNSYMKFSPTGPIPSTSSIIYSNQEELYGANANNTQFQLGGTLSIDYNTASNTAATETYLTTTTISANTLGFNNESIHFDTAGTYASNADTNKRVKLYFAGTSILDTGGITVVGANSWSAHGDCARITGTSVKCSVDFLSSATAIPDTSSYTQISGLSLATTSYALAISGNSTTGGTVTKQMWNVKWYPY